MNLNLLHVFGFEPDLDEEEGEYRRPPRIQAGTLELEAQSGVGEVYLASPPPYWTTESPTHPGVWWIRPPGGQPRVVQVYKRRGELWFDWSDVSPCKVPFDPKAKEEMGAVWSDRAITVPLETRGA